MPPANENGIIQTSGPRKLITFQLLNASGDDFKSNKVNAEYEIMVIAMLILIERSNFSCLLIGLTQERVNSLREKINEIMIISDNKIMIIVLMFIGQFLLPDVYF